MNNDYVLILYELMTHKVECRFRYEDACQALGEDHEITKYRLQMLKDAEKAIELFEKIIDREDQQ